MSIRSMTLTAMLTALMCIAGPLTLPVGPVPVSLTSAVLMLSTLLLGASRAMACCGAYLLTGLCGLPVFSGFTGGVGVLMGPTGGFLLGYLPMTALCGLLLGRTQRRSLQCAAMLGGTGLLYLCGTAWFCWQTGQDALRALTVCVLPFLPGDALKIAALLFIGNQIKTRLQRAGMLK